MISQFLLLLAKETTNWTGLALASLGGVGFFIGSYFVRKYEYIRLRYGIVLTGKQAVAYSWLLVAAGVAVFVMVLLVVLSG